MVKLEICCKFNEDDALTVSEDQGGLCIEIDIADPRSGVACVYLTTETAQHLAEALINWVIEENPCVSPALQVAAFEESGNRHLQILVHSNNQEADARLIAAAPDLLLALRNCVKSMESCLPDFNSFDQMVHDRAVALLESIEGKRE